VGGDTLSATDKEYIGRWYPFPPRPGAAVGLLRTGDDCDEIDFRVDYGVEDPATVGFSLSPVSGPTCWKGVEVPSGSGYRMFEMQDGHTASGTIARTDLDSSRPLRFWIAPLAGLEAGPLLGHR